MNKDVKRLIVALKDSDWQVRRDAAQALGTLGDPRAITTLPQARLDEDTDVSEASAWVQRAIEAILQIFTNVNEDLRVRLAAAEALGQIGDARAVDNLLQVLLIDTAYIVQRAAAGALGQIGDALAVESLLQVLKNEDEQIRMTALKGLEKFGIEKIGIKKIRNHLEAPLDFLSTQVLEHVDWHVGRKPSRSWSNHLLKH